MMTFVDKYLSLNVNQATTVVVHHQIINDNFVCIGEVKFNNYERLPRSPRHPLIDLSRSTTNLILSDLRTFTKSLLRLIL